MNVFISLWLISGCLADNTNIPFLLQQDRRDRSNSDLYAFHSWLWSRGWSHSQRTHCNKQSNSIMKFENTAICCNGSSNKAARRFCCFVFLKKKKNTFLISLLQAGETHISFRLQQVCYSFGQNFRNVFYLYCSNRLSE